MVTMKDVTSSNVAQIGYDSTAMQLFVRFRSGALYRYDGVVLSAWVAFKSASSIGQHLNKTIKPNYPATLIEDGIPDSPVAAAMRTVSNVLAFVRDACRRPALF
ncbi:KTSC domain-containing protein [Aromatoleum evansii]|jgi:hypothetical protein|uniref:KTSC domain-containing protein n=1 Tax=Aromatoleum evansii TaxID=59406 RepID=UPI00145DED55|nr:KTSC domain-containing protein [Aromatoleum evansii]NMG28385.1 KTSC domain-containing protein [Aromatoleum evansii]